MFIIFPGIKNWNIYNQFRELPLPTNCTDTKGTIPVFDVLFKTFLIFLMWCLIFLMWCEREFRNLRLFLPNNAYFTIGISKSIFSRKIFYRTYPDFLIFCNEFCFWILIFNRNTEAFSGFFMFFLAYLLCFKHNFFEKIFTHGVRNPNR